MGIFDNKIFNARAARDHFDGLKTVPICDFMFYKEDGVERHQTIVESEDEEEVGVCHVKPVQKATGGSGAIPKKSAPKQAKKPEKKKDIKPTGKKMIVPQEKFVYRISPQRATQEKASLRRHLAGFSLGGFFQVQGQYLHVRTVVYYDYVADGKTILCDQLVIDPQDTFPIFDTTGTEVVGAEPVHIQVHVLQPNVLSPFSQGVVETTADKVFLVLAAIPLQYPTGVGGTGYRQFGWNKTTTQITPSNEPAWVSVFNFYSTQLPKGAVWDISDQESNMVLGAMRVVDVDNFSQAEVQLQTRWSFEVRIPLPNLNLAKFAFTKVPGSAGLDKIGEGIPLAYETALTEIKSIQRDRGGNSVTQAMAMAEADERADRDIANRDDELVSEFERLDIDVIK